MLTFSLLTERSEISFSVKEMYFLYGLTAVSLIASVIVSRKKTLQALTIALRRFLNLLPPFAIMLLLVSIVLFLVSDKIIAQYLGVDGGVAYSVPICVSRAVHLALLSSQTNRYHDPSTRLLQADGRAVTTRCSVVTDL